MASSNYYLDKLLKNKSPSYNTKYLDKYKTAYQNAANYNTAKINQILGSLGNYKSAGDTAEFKNIYEIYKKQYADNAAVAAADTTAASQALNGGYGDDYSKAAVDDGNNSYMSERGAAIPSLLNAAAQAYANSRSDKLSQVSALQNERNLKADTYKNLYSLSQADAQENYTAKSNADTAKLSYLKQLYSTALSAESASSSSGSSRSSGRSSSSGSSSSSGTTEDVYTAAYNRVKSQLKKIGLSTYINALDTPSEYMTGGKGGNITRESMADYEKYLDDLLKHAISAKNKIEWMSKHS